MPSLYIWYNKNKCCSRCCKVPRQLCLGAFILHWLIGVFIAFLVLRTPAPQRIILLLIQAITVSFWVSRNVILQGERFLNRKLLHLTEMDGIAVCEFLYFYLQGRSPPAVLWKRPTATNREWLKLNTPNATLVLHFRPENFGLGSSRNRLESKIQAKSEGAKNPWGPWSSMSKTSQNFLIVVLLLTDT